MSFDISARSRSLFLSVFGTFFVKGLALIISLLTMPAYFRFFEDQSILGVWLTIVSISSWVLTFDLGIGNGLRNKLVEAIAADDERRCSRLISSSYFATGLIAVAVAAVGVPLCSLIPWNALLNIKQAAVSEDCLTSAMQIMLIGLCAQLLFKTVNAVLYAMQRPATNNAIALVTSILILTWVLTAPSIGPEENLLMMSSVYSVMSNLPLVVCSIVVFCGPMRNGRPRICNISLKTAREVTGIGISFLWAQIMFMLLTGVNEILISGLYGPEHVVEYQVYYKIFGLVSSLMSLALTPLWSQITKAQYENDYAWISKIYHLLHLGVTLAATVEVLFGLNAQVIVNLWIGDALLTVSPLPILVFVLYGVLYSWQSVESTIACGMGMLRIQNLVYTVSTPVRIVAIVGAATFRLPWYSLIVINSITLLVYCSAQWIFTSREIRRHRLTGHKQCRLT